MAATVATLQRDLQHLLPSSETDFLSVLNMVLPRLYDLGNWSDLVYEDTISTDHSYFSLPREAESVLAFMVDDMPRGGRARWQDYRITGRGTNSPAEIYGPVDDGLSPTVIGLTSGQVYQIKVLPKTPKSVLPSEGYVHVKYTREDDEVVHYTFELDGSASLITAEANDEMVVSVQEIRFEGVPYFVEVQAVPESVTATTLSLAHGRGDEISRYRRFRLHNSTSEERTVQMLLKRKCEYLMDVDDVVYLSDRNALKHSILATVAEDNADLERANYHWGICQQLLDRNLATYRGMIRPTLNIDPFGGSAYPVPNLY